MAASGASARIEDVVSSSSYRAIFPASIVPAGSNINSSGSVPVTLPSVQHYELVNGHQRVDVPMGAYISSGSTLQFYNLCSVVRVMVSNSLNRELPLRRISIQTENAMLSGAGTATISGESSNSITMLDYATHHDVNLDFTSDCPATVDALGTSTFDIVVPAFAIDDVTITMYTNDGWFSEVIKEEVALAHNTITTVTLNVTSLAEAPHAELVPGYIFRDAIPDQATSVVFEYNSNVTSGTLLSTTNSPVPIYGNLVGTVWRISTSDSKMNANPNCYNMFSARSHNENDCLPRLESIEFGNGFNTSNVTNMNSMFNWCLSLTSLDLSIFNTSNVTSMGSMFAGCSSLTSLNVSNFNTLSVSGMSCMFYDCNGLTSLDLSSFNTSNVTHMDQMFNGCQGLTSLDLSNFNTASVTNMGAMFHMCSSLTSLNLSSFNTSSVTSMSSMFSGCSSLTSLNLSNFSTSNVTSMSGMFTNCSSLISLNISSFNTYSVTDMSSMFEGCCDLTSLSLSSNFITSNVTYMYDMFYGCSSLTSLDVSSFNTSNVVNIRSMFNSCSGLTSLNLSNFNTSSVTDMGAMFLGCNSLTNLNLSNFNMNNVTDKSSMCNGLSTTSGNCTITCSSAVQTALESGTDLPTSGVTFTWVRP